MRRTFWIIPLVATAAIHGCGVDDRAPESSVEQDVLEACPAQMVMGLDVYDGTGAITWSEVKGSGYDFAFIKATQGDYDKQTTFKANWANAATAGVQRSAYHFFDPTKDGTAQATWFLGELTAAGGMTDDDLPPLLDIECPVASTQSGATSGGSGCEYAGDSGWVATATMKQRIYDYLDAVEAAVHRKPLLYSYPSWFGDVAFTDSRLTTYPLFIASYTTCAQKINVPSPWTTATFWQFSDNTTVHGIPGANNVDVDRYLGSAGDLSTWNAGTIERDAGVDGGPGDAGLNGDAMPDGGNPDTGDEHAGCSGCGTSGRGGAPSLVLALATISAALRRRRR